MKKEEKKMWTIIKKEVKSYFLSPIAYIFIGLFLFMNSIFFYLDVYAIGRVNFEYMFGSLATVLTFAVPILTMRMFAEERKNGTEQILYTSPRSITSNKAYNCNNFIFHILYLQ